MTGVRKRSRVARLSKSVKAISPTIAVLLMIAIAVVAALVVYLWIMGFLNFNTAKAGKAIQIQSVMYTGTHLVVYVQNVGQSGITFTPSQCLYVDGLLRNKASANPTKLEQTKTASIIDNVTLSLNQKIKLKVVTNEGTYIEAYFTVSRFTGDHTLTVHIIGQGQVNLDPPGGAYYDDTVQLTAVPEDHWRFSGWSGDISDTANPVDILVNGNKDVTANFEQYQFQVEFHQAGLGGMAAGTIVSVSIGSDTYQESFNDLPFTTPWIDAGTSVTYSYTPTVSSTAGTQFIYIGVTGPTSPITVTNDETVTGNYGSQYYLTVSSPYGTTGGQGWYEDGATAYASLDIGSVDHGNGTQHLFTSWDGDATGTSIAQSDAIAMNGPKTAIADWKTQYSVSFASSPASGGTTNPSGTDNWYDAGAAVTIDATANVGYAFSSWDSDTSNIIIADESAQTTTAWINGPGTVTATFAQSTYTITVTVLPSSAAGIVTFDLSPPYYYGDVVTLTESPSAGYAFSGWSDDGSGTGTTCQITVTRDMTVTASFTLSPYSIIVNLNPPAGGDVTLDKAAPYYYGDVVTLTESPSAGYAFSGWSDDGSGTGTTCQITVTRDMTVTASFAQSTYTITVTVLPSPAAGTVTPNATGPYQYGDLVVLTEAPSAGYAFSGWSGDGVGSGTIRQVTVTGNMAVTANFTLTGYTLTVNIVGSGSVTKNPDLPIYAPGTVVNLTAVPANGSRLSAWSGDLTGSTNPTSITMNSDKTVTATFVAGTPTSLTWYTWPDQVTLGDNFQSIGILGPGLNGRQIIVTFTRPDGTKIVTTTTTFWLLFSGVFYASTTPDVVGTWTVTVQFLGDATYGASTSAPRSFQVVPRPQYTVSFIQTGAGVAPTVTYHIDSGSDQQSTVPFGVLVDEDSAIYYTYQATVPGASGTQYVLTGTSPSSPETITSNETITGTYKTQYYVTFAVNPSGSGTINRATGWFDSGTLTITATHGSGYAFSSWSSDTGSITFADSGSSSTTATIGGPGTITASFSQLVSVTLLNDGFEGSPWNGNWDQTSSSWQRSSTQHHSGSYSAGASNGNEGYFYSDNMDASHAVSITVDFWFRHTDISSSDLVLYYYDGSNWDSITNLGNTGSDNTWVHYTQTITDSQYFKNNFRIRVYADMGSGEQVWIDDVLITALVIP